ncbi:helix-turn-helix domain-containing protein [Sphaerochaeta sp.]|uniref:HTH araC/xylS-type domain-containing protein n=2 Tax=root TaxID=1 RepID=A0A645A073_9ZZZZ|nr:helix-turn-helix domain-containing protein [Sphaerochaeta sp.]MDD3457255.1 helix-turn-helix domain-containing protein [Sphaerochaeta sp.]
MEKASWKLSKSIMILVMIVLLLCSLVLGYVLSSLRQALLNASYVAIEVIDQSLNSRLMELRKYSLTLELSSANSQIKKLDSLDSAHDPILYELVNQIQSYKYLNPLLDGIFIYYPKLDWIVGDIGSYRSASYYVLDNDLQTEGFDAFLAAVVADTRPVLLFLGDEKNQLYYRKSMLYQGKIVGYLLMRLDTDQLLLSSQGRFPSNGQDYAFALSHYDMHVASSGNLDLIAQRIPDADGSYFLDRSLLLQSRSTALTGLSYQLYLSLADQLKPVSLALKICIGAMLGIALIGLVFAFLLGKRNARPLLKLLQQVGAVDHSTANDAYTLLSRRIDELLQQKDEKIRALQYQREAMGPLCLHHLLSGRVESEHAAVSLLKRYNISFDYPFYVIGVIRVQSKESAQILRFLLEKARNTQIDLLAAEKDGDVVVLFTSDAYLDYPSACGTLGALLEDCPVFKQAKAALGTWHDQYAQAMQSYHEALLLLDQAPQGAWWYQQEDKECTSSLLLQTKDAVMCNQLEHALDLLDELVNRCTCQALETPFARTQLQEIERLIADQFQKAGISQVAVQGELSSVQRCRVQIGSLLKTRGQGNAEASLSIAERAAAIIERDFTDPQLGLYRIAIELGLSNSYLSTAFKARYDIGIVQSINQKRIDLAKELIINTEMSIKEIAIACGFSSDISFIRVFKRHEDQTPGTFRRS